MDKLNKALELFQVDVNIDEKTLKQKRNILLKKNHLDNAEYNKVELNDNMAKINSSYDEILQFIRYKNMQKIENTSETIQQKETTIQQSNDSIIKQNVVIEEQKNNYEEKQINKNNSINNIEKIKFQIFIGIMSALILFFIFLLIYYI